MVAVRCFQDASACREWIRLQQYEARQELSLEWKLAPRRRQQTEELTKLLREMVNRPGLRSKKAMVWWSVLERCGHRSTEEEVDCYVPALRYKEMEGRPCGSLSSDVLELRCKARATKDSASNLHWTPEVACVQSGSAAGLYKGTHERQDARRAGTSESTGSSLSLSRRAQQRDQVGVSDLDGGAVLQA